MDLFEKCYKDERVQQIKAAGLYPYFQDIEDIHGPTVTMNGKEVIMAGSNNYLGLAKHPKVIEAAIEATKKFGTSCSGSRYLNGTLSLHTNFERDLADFLGMESCLLFTTGYLTNQGIIPTIVGRDEYIITDKDNHASIVTGTLLAKAMSANVLRFRTNDMVDLESILQKVPIDAPKLLITDGVFSMSGFTAQLPRILELAKQYKARVLVDEAHSVGVLGKGGIGTASHFGLTNGKDVDLVMGTFSKSFASLGGFVAGKKEVIEHIKHGSTALIFSASMPPANVAAAHQALKMIQEDPSRIQRVLDIGDYMRAGFKDAGFKLLEGETPIIPIVIGDDLLTFKFCKRILELGVFANAVISPGVPPGMQLVRTSYIATLEQHHLDKIIEVVTQTGKELGVI